MDDKSGFMGVRQFDPPSVPSLCRPRRQLGRQGCCLKTNTPVERPDPAVYSQQQQLGLGDQPTWNNPDITTNNFGPFALMTEAIMIVRNLAPAASAVGVHVDAAVSRFGIGYPSIPIGGLTASLPPSSQQQLTISLPQSVLTGEQRIGFHVTLHHPHDLSLQNNAGSQIVDGFYTSDAGREFDVSFPVRNPLASSQIISIQLMSGLSDLNPVFQINASPFGPFEERMVNVHMQVNPSIIGGTDSVSVREATFAGWGQDGSLIGGLTFVVLINS
jgi:hypothetical protein